MKISSRYLLAALLIIITMAPGRAASEEKDLVLVENGKSNYVIVTPLNPTPEELHAAEELQYFLKEISGAELPIATEKSEETSPAIFIGNTFALRLRSDIVPASHEEELLVDVSFNNLYMAGGTKKGTLYAVYTFLEDVLGCRWYAPDASVIPTQDTISIDKDLLIRETPAFEYREPFFYHAYDADWAARNKANGMRPALEAKHGGKISYSHFVHTFDALVPPGEFYDEHPEYFSLIDGKRWREKGQLCLTNPEVLEIAKARVLQWMRESPEARIFSVSQNDNMNPCQCEKCRAVDREEGSHAGTLLRFVNAIADAAAKEFPDKYIDTLAYQYTENVPLITKPRPNVIVRLCHMAPSCDTHPLHKCFWNEKYVRNLKAWRKIADKIYIWHYVTDFSHYPMLFPDVRAIASDIPFYRDNGVDGIFAQGSYQGHGGHMAELKAWLIAKLLWNPEENVKELIEDFHKGYYGPAAEPMLDYFYALHKKTFEKTAHAHLYSGPTKEFLDRETLFHINECFNRAESLAADSPEYLARVKRDRLGLTYVKLLAPHLFGWSAADLAPGAPQDQRARLDSFSKDIKAFNISHISEWQPADKSLEWLGEAVENQLNGNREE